MELKEKVSIFNMAVMDAATRQGEEIIQDASIRYDQKAQQYRARHGHQQRELLKRDMARKERENNKAIAEIARAKRKELYEEELHLKEQIFLAVENKLYQFMRSDAYLPYLCEQIRGLQEQYPDCTPVIYINSTDSMLREELTQRTGIKILIAPQNIMGGLIAEIREKNQRIDESFESRKEKEWNQFHF